MSESARTTRPRAVAVAVLAALAAAAIPPTSAADVYQPAEYSRSSGCAGPIDPIGAYFYGSAATIRRLAGTFTYPVRGAQTTGPREGAIYRATRRFLRDSSYTPSPWRLVNDSRQSFLDTSDGYRCVEQPTWAQVASDDDDRFHVRLFQKANVDVNGYRITVGTPHWDEKNGCGHWVPERMGQADLQYENYDGSGFDFARRTLADAMRPSDLHDVTYVRWRNTARMQQKCNSSSHAGSNGIVAKISYGG